jgi:hypothetical protein
VTITSDGIARETEPMLEPDHNVFEHGTRVEVRQRFDGKWARGFVVETANADGYAIRREHDGMLLPERFAAEDVRIEKRHRLFFRH